MFREDESMKYAAAPAEGEGEGEGEGEREREEAALAENCQLFVF